MKDFNYSDLFKISLDAKLIASLVPAGIIKDFGCFQMICCAWCRNSEKLSKLT